MKALESCPTSREALQEIEGTWANMVARYKDPAIYPIIGFSTMLGKFLEGEGFPNTYSPYKQYRQSIRVLIGEEVNTAIRFHTTVEVSAHSMYCNNVPNHSVVELLESLQESRASFQRWLVKREARAAVIKYCQDCWYPDDDCQYCGLGMQMSIDCNHQVLRS